MFTINSSVIEDMTTAVNRNENPIVVVTQSGSILTANDIALDIFQYTLGEISDQPVEMLIPPRYSDQHTKLRGRFHSDPRNKNTQPMTGKNIFGLKRDGTEFACEIELIPVVSNEGLVMAYITIL